MKILVLFFLIIRFLVLFQVMFNKKITIKKIRKKIENNPIRKMQIQQNKNVQCLKNICYSKISCFLSIIIF